MSAAPPTRRRWFRFSLRTMLVAFTAVAVWLGYNVHLVRQRKAFIEALAEPYFASAQPDAATVNSQTLKSLRGRAEIVASIALTDRDPPPSAYTGWPVVPYESSEPTTTGLPWIRRMLGDKAYWYISYFPGPPFERARELFPEAVVMVAEEPWPWPDIRAVKVASGGWRVRHLRPDE